VGCCVVDNIMEHIRPAHLYKITDVTSGKYYVGKHVGVSQNGYWGSGLRWRSYVKKHGKSNLKYEILLIGEHKYILDIENRYVTLDYIKNNPNCLNLRQGGDSGNLKFPMSEETRKKLSIAKKGQVAWNKGKKLTEEHIQKLRVPKVNRNVENKTQFKKGQVAWNKGIKANPESVKKMILSKIGKPSHRKGKKHTEESIQKMRESHKNAKPHTQETKDKIRNAHLGRKYHLITCPHCNKTGGAATMPRWHFDNCKNRS
jgi:hypothetical protein